MSASANKPNNQDNRSQRRSGRDEQGTGSSWNSRSSNQRRRSDGGDQHSRHTQQRAPTTSPSTGAWGKPASQQPKAATPTTTTQHSGGIAPPSINTVKPTTSSNTAAPGKSWAALLSPQKKDEDKQQQQVTSAGSKGPSHHLQSLGAVRTGAKQPATPPSSSPASTAVAAQTPDKQQDSDTQKAQLKETSPNLAAAIGAEKSSPVAQPAAPKSWANLVGKKDENAAAQKATQKSPPSVPATAIPSTSNNEHSPKQQQPKPNKGTQPQAAVSRPPTNAVPLTVPVPAAMPYMQPPPVVAHPYPAPAPSSPHGFAFQRGGGVVMHHERPPSGHHHPLHHHQTVHHPHAPPPIIRGPPPMPMMPMNVPPGHYPRGPPGMYGMPPMNVPVTAWGVPPVVVPVPVPTGVIPMPIAVAPLPGGPAMPPVPLPAIQQQHAPLEGPPPSINTAPQHSSASNQTSDAPIEVNGIAAAVENLRIAIEPASQPATTIPRSEGPQKHAELPSTAQSSDAKPEDSPSNTSPITITPAAPMSWAARAKAVAAAPVVVDHKPHPPQRLPGQQPTTTHSQTQHRHYEHSTGDKNRKQQSSGSAEARNTGGRGNRTKERDAGNQRGPHPGSTSKRSQQETQHSVSQQQQSPKSANKASPVVAHSPIALPEIADAAAPIEEPAAAGAGAPPEAVNGVEAPIPEKSSEPASRKPSENGYHLPQSVNSALKVLCSETDSWLHGSNEARVQPRGLSNPGHLCFMNSLLQAFLGSNNFCIMMHTLQSANEALNSKELPTLSALSQLMAKFQVKDSEQQVEPKKDILTDSANSVKKGSAKNVAVLGGKPFMPSMLMDLVHRFVSVHGHNPGKSDANAVAAGKLEQQDAQEFYTYLVDAIQQDFLALQKIHKGSLDPTQEVEPENAAAAAPANDEDEDGWLTMSGRRTVKKQEVGTAPSEPETAATALFQGKATSSVACAGAPTSVTVQSFTILSLHIAPDHIQSVADAVDAMTASEKIHGYRPSNSDVPTTATKTVRFQKLPQIMVLHLMRFEYSYSRSTKITKAIAFEPNLSIRSSWLAVGSKDRGAEYTLIATISHHGKTSNSGHYTADVLQPDGRWLRFDDGNVFLVSQQVVLNDRPYLLFYQKNQS